MIFKVPPPFTCFLILISFHETDCEILPSYHCGVGPVSKIASYVVSIPCGQEKLNKCCFKHDRCYDRNHQAEDPVLKTCDTEFEECIERSYKNRSWICAKFLEFTHSGVIRLFGGIYRNLFGHDPTNGLLTDVDSINNIEFDLINKTRQTNHLIRAERHNGLTEAVV